MCNQQNVNGIHIKIKNIGHKTKINIFQKSKNQFGRVLLLTLFI